MKSKQKHIQRLVNYITPRVYIVGGTYIETPEVEGFTKLDNFLKAQRINNPNDIRNAVVKNIKDNPRDWQFWFVIFDFNNDSYTTKTFLKESIFGNSVLVDSITNEYLDKEINARDASNQEFTIGWVAVPSALVDIDSNTEQQFIELFKQRNFHCKAHYDANRMLEVLQQAS